MVLSTRNSGKYMSRRRQEERNHALRNREGYTASQLSYLDITGADGGGQFDPYKYKIDTQPVPPETPLKVNPVRRLDIRTETNRITGD